MKKIVSLFLIVLMASSLLFTGIAEEHEPITLKLSMTATMEEHHGACWQTFAD